MSLYGDLPPPGSSTDSESVKNQALDKDASATPAKPALPAGWSSSITRFKPMLNRKLAPPKPKPTARNIPAGFVAQSQPEIQATASVSSHHEPSISLPTTGAGQSIVPSQLASEKTVDENSWLKARTAQVQRQDIDGLASIRKQMKKPPTKGQPGPISLDDDYDIARPNEYAEFKSLFEDEQRLKEEEERQRSRGHVGSVGGGSGYSRSHSRSRSPDPYSRSRGRSRSRSRSFSSARSRSRSRTRSETRSRSRSRSHSNTRRRSWSPKDGGHLRGSNNREYSRSPSPQARMSGRAPNYYPPRDTTSSTPAYQRSRRSRSRSKSPRSRRNERNRSRSPSPTFSRRRTPSPSHRRNYRQSPSPTRDVANPGQGRAGAYKAFAPPPDLLAKPLQTQNSEGGRPVVINAPRNTMNDVSGEDAFLRRARLSQQRATGAAALPQSQTLLQHHIPSMQEHHNHGVVASSKPQTSFKSSPSNVILLTNMVGPGEVDDTLQEETAGECEKYGSVVRCLIFEVQNGKVPPEEAVRIFVKFGAVASAERALRDLDGRFFGGRQVHCQFFDEKRFDLLQLAP
ncbi:hypothetical protein BGX27_009800 [Mortierella sp. AM989]|nr:hypothetical protein BGX27_009800 [Mortierella sp. AM989]